MLRLISLPLTAALLFISTAIAAQTNSSKYGHMNLGNLLDEMPETKKANEQLTAFADKLTAKDDSLGKAFQAAYVKLEQDARAGTVPPIQIEQRKVELQKMQEDIQKFEQDAQKQVADHRAELLKPILTRVEEAIKAVAKANGYQMIFDTSSGVMLFAAESEDVTALVKKQLGM